MFRHFFYLTNVVIGDVKNELIRFLTDAEMQCLLRYPPAGLVWATAITASAVLTGVMSPSESWRHFGISLVIILWEIVLALLLSWFWESKWNVKCHFLWDCWSNSFHWNSTFKHSWVLLPLETGVMWGEGRAPVLIWDVSRECLWWERHRVTCE